MSMFKDAIYMIGSMAILMGCAYPILAASDDPKLSSKQGKGGARGGYIYSDFLPEFRKGKVTIAVKAFLRSTGHRNRLAPTSGHISLWLESATLPEVVSAPDAE